jgi:endonuclease/exonuclease/phosphatase family metal-dependent hydrolase
VTEPIRSDVGALRVATLNVWDRYGDWPARRAVLTAGFNALEPDVVALQETVVTPGGDQVAEILDDGYHVAHQHARTAEGMGISVASRWPIRRVHEVDLHVTQRTTESTFPCTALIAEIDAPDPIGHLLFVNHFPNPGLDFELERELQAVTTARFIERLAADRHGQVVLVGDFDADPQSASTRFWAGRQSLGGMSVCYRDAWESIHPDDPGHTFTPLDNPTVKSQRFRDQLMFWDWPFRRIDYVFVRFGSHCGSSLQVRSCARMFDAHVGGVWASDHFGVTADLAFPQPSEG